MDSYWQIVVRITFMIPLSIHDVIVMVVIIVEAEVELLGRSCK
jgi:hypothetical protein